MVHQSNCQEMTPLLLFKFVEVPNPIWLLDGFRSCVLLRKALVSTLAWQLILREKSVPLQLFLKRNMVKKKLQCKNCNHLNQRRDRHDVSCNTAIVFSFLICTGILPFILNAFMSHNN
ncbi:hypothetical protein Hamer_G002862 [Homarus americanus]|uniref:Uncharacterized protein n=1 Tax=Homarus americanus TaxID=6706 RepID=A0A8J5MU31_HOMAM|nr:hypothetical protein Hamer_G002862 [Homarus americanus]